MRNICLFISFGSWLDSIISWSDMTRHAIHNWLALHHVTGIESLDVFFSNQSKQKKSTSQFDLILKLVIFVQEIIFLFIWNKSSIWEILSFSRHKHHLSDIQSGYILNSKFYTQIQTFTHWNLDKIWWKHPGQRSPIDKAVTQLHHQLTERVKRCLGGCRY